MSRIRSASHRHPTFTTVLCVASSVVVSLVAAPAAGSAVPLRAHVTVSTASTTVGHAVVATVRKSTVPKGDRLKHITVTWGDGSQPVTVAALTRKPSHRYQVPGRFTVKLKIVDAKGHISRGSAGPVRVTEASGSFSGSAQPGRGLDFFVSFNRKNLQDVSIPLTTLLCTPGGAGLNDHLAIPSIPISVGGAFHSVRTVTGVISGAPARFSYTFSGRFRRDASGAPGATGTFRETVRFTDAAARTCTTNTQIWTATRDVQPTQRATRAPVGSYSGSAQPGRGLVFFVSFNRKNLEDVSIPLTTLGCSPGGAGLNDHLQIPSIPISLAGAFHSARTVTGVIAGSPATFRFVFNGHFHSLASNGAPRFAGQFREIVTFTDTAARTCDTNEFAWEATRDAQPSQQQSPPPAGNYSGSAQPGRGMTFTVPPSRAALQTISIPLVTLGCSPGGAGANDQLSIASIPVNAAGAFSATQSQTGVFAGQPATFRFTFSGHYESLAPSGAPRAAGLFRETVTFTDTVARTCTSNEQTWTATKTG